MPVLPVHHIDSCVILDALLPLESRTKRRQLDALSYVHRLGLKYKGLISLPAMGEILNHLIEFDDEIERSSMFNQLCKWIGEKDIDTYSLHNDNEEHRLILEGDDGVARLDPMDKVIYACFMADRTSNTLVTTDGDLLALNKPHKNIKPPKDFSGSY